MNDREIERLIGAVILPSVRPSGGLRVGAPERRPSRAYLERFPPAGLIGFGRRLSDGVTIEGLASAIAAVREHAVQPLFACCDLEQGAGYHLPAATILPPARALEEAEMSRPGTLFEAGRITGLEARAAGIELVLAPVLDVNSNPANPIIGARAFGQGPGSVVRGAGRFLSGLASAEVGASLKHFPGHGDTSVDSHLGLPHVGRSLLELEALELAPYRELLKSPAARALGQRLTIMVGHLDVPALTGKAGLPTSLSPHVIGRLSKLGFGGAVLTDGLEMLAVAAEPELGVRALEAGCHGLLAPCDEQQLAQELLAAVEAGRLAVERLRMAAQRMFVLKEALLVKKSPQIFGSRPGLGLAIALDAFSSQPGWRAMQAELSRAAEGGIEILGDAALVERVGGGLCGGAVRLGLAREGGVLPDFSSLSAFIWFGTPESLPEAARLCPHLWAWSPGKAAEAAVRHLISEASGL